jgi:hypothetical protein
MEIECLFPAHPEKFTGFFSLPGRAIAPEISYKLGYAVEFSDH